MKPLVVEVAVANMIAETEIAVDPPAVFMLSVGDGDVQGEAGIEPSWIMEKGDRGGNLSLRRQH